MSTHRQQKKNFSNKITPGNRYFRDYFLDKFTHPISSPY